MRDVRTWAATDLEYYEVRGRCGRLARVVTVEGVEVRQIDDTLWVPPDDVGDPDMTEAFAAERVASEWQRSQR